MLWTRGGEESEGNQSRVRCRPTRYENTHNEGAHTALERVTVLEKCARVQGVNEETYYSRDESGKAKDHLSSSFRDQRGTPQKPNQRLIPASLPKGPAADEGMN